MKISLKELKTLIHSVLVEKRRLHDTDRLTTELNKLKSYLNKDLFIHFTNDASLQGVNVKTQYNTPLGIYAYPLNTKIYNQLIKHGEAMFAMDRKQIIVYREKGNLLRISQYTLNQFEADAKVLGASDELIDKIKKAKKTNLRKKISNPAACLMYLLYDGEFSSLGSSKATNRLIKLGYSGIYDDVGGGVIHRNEPFQVFFVNSAACEIVDVIENPIFLMNQTNKRIIKRLDLVDYDSLSKTYKKHKPLLTWQEKYKQINSLSDEEKLDILKIDAYAFSLIRNPSEELKLNFIKLDPLNIMFIDDPSIEVQKIAIEKSGGYLGSFRDVDDSLQLWLASLNPHIIFYLKHPIDDALKIAIDANPKGIKNVENPSDDVVEYAIRKDPNCIALIGKPKKKFVDLAKKLGFDVTKKQ